MGDIHSQNDQGFQKEIESWYIYIMIEQAHRAKSKDKNKKRPTTIVLRLVNFKGKSIILKDVNKLKGSDVYISKDFSWEETEFRKKPWDEVK